MKKHLLILFVLLVTCTLNVVAQKDNENQTTQIDSSQIQLVKPWTDVIINNLEPSQWKWNKTKATRFTIRGDFDGDGFEENLFEGPNEIYSDNKEITPLKLDGDLGVYFLINEGDLDGDGTDEISLMTVYRDYTNINFFRIYSYTGNSWKEIFACKVREFDCPNYTPTRPEEMFTHLWKKKNKYDMNKVVLKHHDGVVDMISLHPCGRYAIEHIKIINKRPAKRQWGTIIEPRTDL